MGGQPAGAVNCQMVQVDEAAERGMVVVQDGLPAAASKMRDRNSPFTAGHDV